jgi:hypothetical protein
MDTQPANSVYRAFQTAAASAIQDEQLARIYSDVVQCDRAFWEIDIRSGAYVSPEGRKSGPHSTNEKDHIGYIFQFTTVQGSGSVRSSDTSRWQQWLQLLCTRFNNRRPDVPDLPDSVTLLPAEAGEYGLPENEKLRGFKAAAVRVTFWCRQPRDLTA